MSTFKDTTGREWTCAVTLNTVIKLRKIGCDLNEIVKGDLLDRFGLDPELFINTLWIVCGSPADVTDEQFAEVLGGDVLDEARMALMDAIIAFFPAPKRGPLQKLWDKMRQVQTLAVAEVNQAMDATTPEMILTDLIANGLKKAAGNSQESQAG